MNDYYSRYSITGDSPLRESFDVYLKDKHAALDLITGMTCNETRGVLRDLYIDAPHALAKALAIRFPWSAEQADETEGHVQDLLPFESSLIRTDGMLT